MSANVIALDGPAASGKSSVAKQLAERLHIPYISTGALYRALAWKWKKLGHSIDEMNDDAMTDFLNGKESLEGLDDDDFFNPFLSMLKAGYGSMEYRGQWQIFDQILVNNALANAPKGGLKIQKVEADKYYGKVFNADFLTQQDGRYAGTPYRTFSGGQFINGYSDHYPTFIIVSK